MVLSIFVNNECFCIFSPIYSAEIRVVSGIADRILGLLCDAIDINDIDELRFSSGDVSFTTTRILFSVIKSIYLCNPTVRIVGIDQTLLPALRSERICGARQQVCGISMILLRSQEAGVQQDVNPRYSFDPIFTKTCAK